VPVMKPVAPPAHLLQFKPIKSGTPSTTIREKPCVNITVRNAYGDAPAPVFGSPAGNHESSAGLSIAGKATITMAIIIGMIKPQRMPLIVIFPGSSIFHPFSTITLGRVYKFNPKKLIGGFWKIANQGKVWASL
jgi:hypothetical protein